MNPRGVAQQVAAAEAERLKLEVRAEAVREQRRALEAALEEVQLSCAAGQADLAGLKRDLAGLEGKVPAQPPTGLTQQLSCTGPDSPQLAQARPGRPGGQGTPAASPPGQPNSCPIDCPDSPVDHMSVLYGHARTWYRL